MITCLYVCTNAMQGRNQTLQYDLTYPRTSSLGTGENDLYKALLSSVTFLIVPMQVVYH